jgi:hypothetical protein
MCICGTNSTNLKNKIFVQIEQNIWDDGKNYKGVTNIYREKVRRNKYFKRRTNMYRKINQKALN